ncbi:NADPH-dependent ferric siderophore reductase [Streptomyces phaeoluteigriseus]|uniref:NADPH-dependent ferric siderophore reductase n=1 Tax=Streptomyces phaeoluteigriseus TaxID=114686 RepID=A0A1V6MT61_9ACTN|nr:siderophore-interacting protein [Streptomyces phaeoluteigriseus]OQD55463.1 NADPH-dependent ferric siderophore reductase [Streptomyces phaeoluteigriseus]
MTTAVAAPFRFFSLHVVRTRRLGPSLVRVTLAGEDLRYFFSDGYDQSLSLFLPHPGQDAPAVPVELGDGWWQGWRELPDDVRAVMRSYTLRELRRDPDEVDVDFVLHTPAGPASAWAGRARAGDRVLLLGPAVADNRAIRFRPPQDTDLVLLWGDETALPAIASILQSLPAGRRVRAWLEVHDPRDAQDLVTAADAEITWLTVGTSLDALRGAELPSAARPYVWLAGESGSVKALRRHFVRERGIDRQRITFVGYWRQGMTEEQLRAAE